MMLPVQTLARSFQDSATRANDDCAGLGRACTAAAKELRAARELIAGYEAHIAAADERIAIARKEIESLKGLSALERERANELDAVIAAERRAKAALIKIKEEQARRVASLEKKLNRSRKVALIAGVAAVVAILIGVRK